MVSSWWDFFVDIGNFVIRVVTKVEFEFEYWRSSNVFAKCEIRQIVGDACIGCRSHFHPLVNAKHAPALNMVNDSQHTSHFCKQCRALVARHFICCWEGGLLLQCRWVDHLSRSKLSHMGCYIIVTAMHLLGSSADLCCKILWCFLHWPIIVLM